MVDCTSTRDTRQIQVLEGLEVPEEQKVHPVSLEVHSEGLEVHRE